MKEVLARLRSVINEVGYEDYRKATFILDLGKEEELDNPKLMSAIDAMYDYYMDNDYFTSPVDENLIDAFYAVYADDEDSE